MALDRSMADMFKEKQKQHAECVNQQQQSPGSKNRVLDSPLCNHDSIGLQSILHPANVLSSCHRAAVNSLPSKCIERVASVFVVFLMRLECNFTTRRLSTIIYPFFDWFRLQKLK